MHIDDISKFSVHIDVLAITELFVLRRMSKFWGTNNLLGTYFAIMYPILIYAVTV